MSVIVRQNRRSTFTGRWKEACRLNLTFSTSYRTIERIENSRAKIMAINRNRFSLDVLSDLFATHPVLEQILEEFITFACHQRLPVSSKILTARASKIASELVIEGFFASNGCLQRFIRRILVQPQFKLYRKGGAVLPSCHVERME